MSPTQPAQRSPLAQSRLALAITALATLAGAITSCAVGTEPGGGSSSDGIAGNAEYYAPWTGGVRRQIGGGHFSPSHSARGEGYAWDFYPQTNGVAGDEIRAVAPGVIRNVRLTGGQNCTSGGACTNTYGNYVVVQHDFNGRSVSSLYLHLMNEPAGSALRAQRVGDTVARGQLIGHMAATGYSSPANFVHLHFQFQDVCGSYFCNTVDYTTLNAAGFRDVGLLASRTSVTSGNTGPGETPMPGEPPPTPTPTCPAGTYPIWTCSTDRASRVRCIDGRTESEPCASGCESRPVGTDDVCVTAPVRCGADGQSCCSGSACNTGLSCSSGICRMTMTPAPSCGSDGAACCAGSACNSGLTCTSGTCRPVTAMPPACGASGQSCCAGTGCNAGLTCMSGTCRTSAPSWDCAVSAYAGAQYWTCSGGDRYRCESGVARRDDCSYGCLVRATGEDDVCTARAASWTCANSAYAGGQYWTCSGGSLYRCDGSQPVVAACPAGCTSRALGTNDTCN